MVVALKMLERVDKASRLPVEEKDPPPPEILASSPVRIVY